MNLFTQFLTNHGERLFFMVVATAFGLAFIKIGMGGEGKTLLIAVATLALNKARGSTLKKPADSLEKPKEGKESPKAN